LNTDLVSSEVGAAAYAKEYNVVFRLNKTTMANIENVAKTCKFTDYLKKHLQYPPRGIIPQPKIDKNSVSKCTTISETIMKATKSTNPCFNQYNILGTCPLLWDVLGSPGTIDYTPSSATVYFNRVDVKKAINAPQGIYWSLCRSVPLGQNPAAESEPTSFKLLPRVIERSERTILGHGSLDFVILSSATLLSIQNMTWNGKQGFQSQPSNEFFVPDYASEDLDSLAGKGVLGVTHTERGLTYVEIFQSGHMVPENSPSAAYRHLEFLLGRVKSLSDRSPYTVAPVSYPF
jgi:carboxypeptidase D